MTDGLNRIKPPARCKRYFLYAAPFPALVFFKIWASPDRDPVTLFRVACIMFAYCLVIIILARRWYKPGYFEWATAGYFGFAVILLLVWPDTAGKIFARYAVTGIFICLFAAAFFPPVMGMAPFTMHYAKGYTPEAYWENPVFITINRIMTHVWSGIFALCVFISLYPSVITRAVIPVTLILGFGLPFNLRFPDIYLRRMGLPVLAEQKQMAESFSGAISPATGMTEMPNSAWEAISGMVDRFDADAAGDLSAVIGFMVSESESFEAYLHIQNGVCRLETSLSGSPDLMIRTTAEVWLKIARGEISGQAAFSRREYHAEGNLGLLVALKHIFSRDG